jgi:O-antigen ligase
LIPNIKNLYVRLLAETGLLGFWLWIAFLLSILGRVRQLLQAAPGSAARFVGVAGLFIWLTAALRNVTQDSLTFPLMWVGFGIILGFELQATIPLLLGASPWTNEKDS